MSAPIAPENERGLCLPLSPKTLSDSASLSQDKHLERPYLRLHQTLPVDISPETPCDTTTPLHYDSYEYTRSREHFTPQGAGNKSRRDLKLLEYNADTPTALLEASVAQRYWLQELYPKLDQFNSIHEKLLAKWQDLKPYLAKTVHFAYLNPPD